MFATCTKCGGAAHPASPHFSGTLDCMCIACSMERREKIKQAEKLVIVSTAPDVIRIVRRCPVPDWYLN